MTTTCPKPRARRTRGLDLELTIPSNKPGQPALMVRATSPEDTVHQNNPESLADYEKRAGQTLEGLAMFARLLVSLHSGPLTDIVPVPPETRAGYQKSVCDVAAEAVATGMLDLYCQTASDKTRVETIYGLRGAGVRAIDIVKMYGPTFLGSVS